MDIKFISYDGEYPNLCSGTLVLEIDGNRRTFGSTGGGLFGEGLHSDNPRFWTSGGGVSFDEDWSECVTLGEWKLDVSALPDDLKPYGNELIDLFNEHVPFGCCGGCV